MPRQRTDILMATCAALDQLRAALLIAENQNDELAIDTLERAIADLAATIDELSTDTELPRK